MLIKKDPRSRQHLNVCILLDYAHQNLYSDNKQRFRQQFAMVIIAIETKEIKKYQECRLRTDLSRIPVNKGIKSRLGWTKYSDLYEIVHPSLGLISLCLLTGA